VIGATGFIGRSLVGRLRESGRNVSVLVRRLVALPAMLRDPGIRVLAGDITEAASLRRAVAGCAAVVHLATGAGSTVEELRRTMVAGTVNVAEACLAAGVKRLVFTSTIAVYFMGRRGERITEATPRDPRPELRGAYARAKIECEEALERLARERGLPLIVLRPAVVVGGDARFQHGGLGYWASDTWCVGWGMGKTPVPFVLVEDVSAAIMRALDAPGIEGRSFNLAGDVRLSARELVGEVARAHGRPVHFHPRPLWLAQAMEVGKWCVKVAARRPAPWPSYRDLTTRSLVAHLDCSAAKEVLGWRPVADPAEFLARAARAPT
jgi:nucleoside-diphosphate-sugar epimerase